MTGFSWCNLLGNFPEMAPAARYGAAVAASAVLVLASVSIGMAPFLVEHAVVLLVVAVAMAGGRGPAITAAVIAVLGDNLFARAPVGRPAITGTRDVIDLAVFLAVAAIVGWLVDRLRAARRQAVAAAAREQEVRRERDGIVRAIAHDLAAPLSAIQGTIRFARRHGSEAQVDLPRLFGRLERATERATTLARTLADMELLHDDAFTLTCRAVDFNSMVADVAAMLDQVSERHPIAVAAPPCPIEVFCDEGRIRRVVENLITNAIKYSPDGGLIEATVSADAWAVELTVADRGIGLTEEARNRLFEAGYRAPAATETAAGLGLGLHIAAEVVRRHGGEIRATSRDGGGALFSVRLPLRRYDPSREVRHQHVLV